MIELGFDIGRFLYNNYDSLIAGFSGVASGLIILALMVPGNEPERTLSRIVNGLAKISRKPKQ